MTTTKVTPGALCGPETARGDRRIYREVDLLLIVSVTPSRDCNKLPHAPLDLVPNLADSLDGLVFRVRKGPIFALHAGYERARFTAAHRHEQARRAGKPGCEQLRPGRGEVDPNLSHDLDDLGLYAVG